MAGPIGLVAKYNLLEEYGVIKMYPLYGGTLTIPSNIANIIFISRPQLELMDLIAENIRGSVYKKCCIYEICSKDLMTLIIIIIQAYNY